MFRTFAKFMTNGARDLVRLHPSDLTAVLELAWDRRKNRLDLEVGHPFHRSDVPGFSTTWLGSRALTPPAPTPPAGQPDLNQIIDGINRAGCGVLWDHLIYAYMIENTRIYEIFRRVVSEFLHGEKLGVPGSAESHLWLRATEELFYRDPPPFFMTAVTSYLRKDIDAERSGIYQRVFGMNLNHGPEEGKAYPYLRAEAANNEFVATFEEFLREIWVGMENVNNTSGANPKDDAKIADLAEKLHDMLRTRRETGNLSREEFVFVSWMSWFHLTVESDLPIIQDLRAQAASSEERLFKIAQRVGLPAHGLSKSYFDIADSISRILILIETGVFNTPGAAPALYTPAAGGPEEAMRTIIRHWSIITGREMKARRVTPS
ncbi:hypothetical protein LPW11_04415 [Geomonas sp. RF6]|uniref:hypothetical protein n=1 Tax=Geomonas sp. RF6 TaxID=2897342 RepID=UPI001E4DB985|nr:hypothetical protein [Geomonas sp. RF6]UFS71443.1 hypothetical protein LPW11_04415 [Geomonas sp. RF6]